MLKTSGTKDKEPMRQLNVNNYSEIINALPAAVYTCDTQGYLTTCNEAAVKLLGRRPVFGKDLWYMSCKMYNMDGTPLSAASSPLADTLRTGKSSPASQIIVERPDGTRSSVLSYPQPLIDDHGGVVGAINMLVDIGPLTGSRGLETHLAKTIEAMRFSEDQYHRMVSEIQDYAIILLSKDGIILNWNKGAEKIKGYRPDEIIGKSFRMLYPPEDQRRGLPEKLLNEAAQAGKANHEGWRVRKDGSRFWGNISITALHDSEGYLSGFSKVTRDLTDRRQNELRILKYNEDLRMTNELLRQSEDRYHRMVSEVEDYAIILLSVDGHVLNWNKGAQKIKGYEADEIIGKHFSVFYSPEDRRKGLPDNIINRAITTGKALYEGWRLRKDGSVFWGSVVLTAIHNDDGGLVGFTKVTRDLTEKKRTDERLKATTAKLEEKNRELERMNEELSSFAYISSHDLQEPLRKIQTFSDRILELEYENLSDKGKDYFERMQRGAQRMQKLIRDILAYSRTTTSDKKFEPTNLNEILNQSKTELEIQIHEKNALIESVSLPTLNVIPFQIQQLFNNLINNALKFSKPDTQPHIRILCEMVDEKEKIARLNLRPGSYCHISIQDNGIGFDPAFERKIFEVFQRLHGRSEYGGTGIGLAICKKIVENHHGILFAEGVPDQGATFHIYLPVTIEGN
jgi:PAS domain S-box-containing protein